MFSHSLSSFLDKHYICGRKFSVLKGIMYYLILTLSLSFFGVFALTNTRAFP